MKRLTRREIEETLEECYGYEGDAATMRLMELNRQQRRLDEQLDVAPDKAA